MSPQKRIQQTKQNKIVAKKSGDVDFSFDFRTIF